MPSLESSIFEWEDWDEIDSFGSVQFRKCKFVKDVPPFKVGDIVDAIMINYAESKMCVYVGDREVRYPICFDIGAAEQS